MRSQLAGVRAQLADTHSQLEKHRSDAASHKSQLEEKSRAVSQAEIKVGTLRNYLADNGIIIDESGLPIKGTGPSATRSAELEAQLEEHSQQRADLERQLQTAETARAEAMDRVEQLSGQIERIRTKTPDPAALAALDTRATEAERKLSEAETAHQAKVQQVEGDYLAAVRYIK